MWHKKLNSDDKLKARNLNILFILAFFLIVLIQLLARGAMPINYLGEGYPTDQVISTARSIWDHGTIQVAKFHHYYDLARTRSFNSPETKIWQDVFATGKNGELYPKHAILSAIIATPFYGLFGDTGFLYLNFLIIFIIVYSIYLISNEFTSRNSSIFVLTTLVFTSIFSPSSLFSFSYDLQMLAITLLGLKLLKSYPIIGSALAASTIFIRPSNILIIPFCLIARLPKKNPLAWLLKTGTTLIIFIILFMVYNYYLFGSFFTTSYHRAPYFVNGQYFFEGNLPLGFDYKIFLSGFMEKLFNPETGLLLKNLPFFFLLPAVAYFINNKEKLFFYSLILGACLTTCYYFSYPFWQIRYCYIPIGLLSIVVIVFLCNVTYPERSTRELT